MTKVTVRAAAPVPAGYVTASFAERCRARGALSAAPPAPKPG